MSEFKTCFTTILAINPHPDPETTGLEIATVYGFNIVVKKNSMSVGDVVYFIPVDSILPNDIELLIFPPESKVKLSGSRVRQIRLRKYPSQGLLVESSTIIEHLRSTGKLPKYTISSDLLEKDTSNLLGITKYEPPVKEQRDVVITSKKRLAEHPQFHKYEGLSNIKWGNPFKEDEKVVVQLKLHGCLQANSLIQLVDGSFKSIKEIVDNRLPVQIWGFDHEKNTIVPTNITNYFNNGKSEDWLKISFTRNTFSGGNSYRTLEVTPNHKFWSIDKKEYIQARELKQGEKILFKRDFDDLSYIQEQILIGIMLGDGSLNKNSILFSHKKDHEEYIDYTLKSLSDISGNKQKEIISGHGSTMVRARTQSLFQIQSLFKDWFNTGNKQFPKSFIDKLHPIALAFWYMDDGSLSHNLKQEDRLSLSTCNFTRESCENLIEALSRFDIKGVIQQSTSPTSKKDTFIIRINSEDSNKFFLLISQYVPPCMRYKLPSYYRNLPTIEIPKLTRVYKSRLIEQEVLNIEKMDMHKKNKTKYDIETETHNFFANGILVHNSNARFANLPRKPRNIIEKILKFFKLLPKYEVRYGSNNVDITLKNNKSGFYDTDVYGRAFKDCKASEKVRKNEVIFGEIIGEGIQKNYHYGHKTPHFVLFDVKVFESDTDTRGRWLSPPEVENYAKERGFDMVPILYTGLYDSSKIDPLVSGVDPYYPKHKVREGIVIKSFDSHNYNDILSPAGKKARKVISPEYLDDKNNTDFH